MKNKLIIILLLLITLTVQVKAVEVNEIDIYVFTREGCDKCKKLHEFLDSLEYDNIESHYMLNTDEEFKDIYQKMKEIFIDENTPFGLPFTIIGGKYFIGYNEKIAESIKGYIEDFSKEELNYVDVFKLASSNQEIKEEYIIKDDYDLPFFGKVNPKKVNLTLLSVLLGFLDGINPCGMWILLFIITILLNTNDKKKLIILGGTFILTSGIFYLALMMAWISIFDNFNSNILLLVTGIFAIIFAIYNIYKYIKKVRSKNEGCEVTNVKTQRKLTKKLKKIISTENIFKAALGVAIITITVNLVEVACSAGWPAIYSNILIANNLSFIQRLLYTLIYILFFLIDDIIVFIIAISALKVKAVSNVLTKYSYLIGGILMLLFGILMVFFPNIITTYL